jgi:hypothetical protein
MSRNADNFQILSRLRKFLVGRLFKFNHVILEHQAVSPALYLIVMVIEFLEMMFYVFYKVEIVNEFAKE